MGVVTLTSLRDAAKKFLFMMNTNGIEAIFPIGRDFLFDEIASFDEIATAREDFFNSNFCTCASQ